MDLDQLINTLDAQTQRELKVFVQESADLFASEGDAENSEAAKQANAGLESLNPALSQSAQTFRALTRDEARPRAVRGGGRRGRPRMPRRAPKTSTSW